MTTHVRSYIIYNESLVSTKGQTNP